MTAHTPDLPPDILAAIEEVRADRQHGASWLARRAAEILARLSTPDQLSGNAISRLAQAHQAALALAGTRLSMAAVANTVARIYAATNSKASETEQLTRLHQQAQQTIAAWSTASDAIFGYARPLLGKTLYTHSRSGTVEQVLIRLAEERKAGALDFTLIVSESHPGDEGVTLATTLARHGMPVTLVADSACGLFIEQADAVVVGADSVRADGSVVNKVGTFPLALMAREAHVPVYVLCETLKIAAPDFPLVLEEADVTQLLPVPQPGVTPRNIAFDHTPAALITSIITERGILARSGVSTYADAAGRALAHLHS